MNKTDFIKKVAGIAIQQAVDNKTHFVLPSVIISMACLESGFGSSTLMTKANAYFGIKATQSWIKSGGKVYNSKTKECYDGKTLTSITACFRAYDSLIDSVADFVNLMHTSRYEKVLCVSDFEKAISIIKNSGYATDTQYVSKNVKIYQQYKLWQYDTGFSENVSRETLVKKIYEGDMVEVTVKKDINGRALKCWYPCYIVDKVYPDNTVLLKANNQVFARLPINNIKIKE